MINRYLATAFIVLAAFKNLSAQNKIENLIIITSDGLRWQEVFKGLDVELARSKRFNEGDSTSIFRKYYAATASESRKKIFPFLWTEIAANGQLYGNRIYGNKVDVANPYRISYPGYNELFTGYADSTVNSNSHPDNANINLLGFLQQQTGFQNKIAAYGAWETFNRILNESKLGFPVIAAFDKSGGEKPNANQSIINKMLMDSYKPWGTAECLDVFTHYAAFEHLKTQRPRVMYIAYGETDEWAHSAKYSSYLNAANQVDKWLKDMWDFIQSDVHYKDKTALLLTVDHGRGEGDTWVSHGKSIQGSNEAWFAVIGPGIKAKGEQKKPMQVYLQQLAQTAAHLLSLTFKAEHPVAAKVEEVWK